MSAPVEDQTRLLLILLSYVGLGVHKVFLEVFKTYNIPPNWLARLLWYYGQLLIMKRLLLSNNMMLLWNRGLLYGGIMRIS